MKRDHNKSCIPWFTSINLGLPSCYILLFVYGFKFDFASLDYFESLKNINISLIIGCFVILLSFLFYINKAHMHQQLDKIKKSPKI